MNPNPDDKPATWRWALQVFLLLTSSFAVLALYFGIHKPATGAVLAGTARTASSLVFWLAVTFLSAALGRRLVGTQLEKEPPTVRLALSAGLGLAVLSILLMVFGLLGLLARWQLLLLLLGLALLALPGFRPYLVTMYEPGAGPAPPRAGSAGFYATPLPASYWPCSLLWPRRSPGTVWSTT
jgi:hypothetical protein